jgi:hypothetical protein
MAKEHDIPKGLYWQGKRTEIERISFPFKTIETIKESMATRKKRKFLCSNVADIQTCRAGLGITVSYGVTTST